MANKRQVFYSFHFDKDVFRVQQIRNMGVLEGNEPVSSNSWEDIKRKGETSIKKWIDDNMYYRSCVIVLIGEQTYKRKWVQYEIIKAWNEGKAMFGIYIHNLKDPRYGKSNMGPNPFYYITASNGTRLSNYINCYNPKSLDAYSDIKYSLSGWIERAIKGIL